MNEKKNYDFNGTVTISSEEYRDLVTAAVKNERDADDYRSRSWSAENKVKSLEAALKEIKSDLELRTAFIESKKEFRLAFKMFTAGVEEEDDAE